MIYYDYLAGNSRMKGSGPSVIYEALLGIGAHVLVMSVIASYHSSSSTSHGPEILEAMSAIDSGWESANLALHIGRR